MRVEKRLHLRGDLLGRCHDVRDARDLLVAALDAQLHEALSRDAREQRAVAVELLEAERLACGRQDLDVLPERADEVDDPRADVRDVQPALQLAQERLLTGVAHEVGVVVAVAHVLERVQPIELAVPGLDVDHGVVVVAVVRVQVAAVDVDVDAMNRLDRVAERAEVDRHVVVDRAPDQRADGLQCKRRAAVRVRRIDLREADTRNVDAKVTRNRKRRQRLAHGIDPHEDQRVGVAGSRLRAVAPVIADQQGDRRIGRRLANALQHALRPPVIDVLRVGQLVGHAERPVVGSDRGRPDQQHDDREEPGEHAPERPALLSPSRAVDVDRRRKPVERRVEAHATLS